MKLVLKAVLAALVLAGFVLAAVRVRQGDGDEEGDAGRAPSPAAAGARGAKVSDEPGVTLDEETQKRIGLAMEAPAASTLRADRRAYGRVLDPAPLVALDAERTEAEAALAAAKAEVERLRALVQDGENAPRRALEAAEAQFRTAESQALSARRRLALGWGEPVAALDAGTRRDLVDRLVGLTSVWIRVDLPAGESVEATPAAARVAAAGREETPLRASAVEPAPAVDAGFQGQGFLLRVDAADSGGPPLPRPGAAVVAWLELPGEPQAGVLVPRAAVVRYEGRAWVYAEGEEGRYTRREIAVDHPVEQGWFVSAAGGLKAGDRIVVTGAQLLLSEEFKAMTQKEESGGEKDKPEGDRK